MATTLENLERLMLRDALKKENSELLSKIDAKLIEIASKGTVVVNLVDDVKDVIYDDAE